MGPRACILEGMENLTGKGIVMTKIVYKTANRLLDSEIGLSIACGLVLSALVIQFIIVSTN